MTNSRVMVSSFTRNRKEIYKSLKKTVRYTKHLKTGPKLDFEFLVTLCQKQRQKKLEVTSWCVHHIHGCTGMRKKRIVK